jgi:hypothetical protein
MTPTDPLGEALDLVKSLMPYVADKPFVLADVTKRWARLDALSPVWIQGYSTIRASGALIVVPNHPCWAYPDAPSEADPT